MSKFSDELNNIIRSRSGTIKDLSKDVGIERTLLHRVLKGERQLELNDIDRLCDYLELTFEEKSKLLSFYEMDIIGEKKYNQRLSIRNVIENISEKLDMETAVIPSSLNFDIKSIELEDVEVCINKHQVEKLIKSVLINMSNSKNTIRCFLPFQARAFYETIQSLLKSKNNKLTLNQLLMIERNNNSSESTLMLISEILSLASIAAENYQANYFYSDTTIEAELPTFMPYYFFNDTELVTISADFERAVFYRNTEILNLIKEQFNAKYNLAFRFVKNVSKNCEDLIDRLKLVKNRLHDVRSIEPQPCFSNFINKENVDKFVNKNIPNRDAIMKLLVDFYKNIKYTADRKLFFTREGLEQFVKDGIISVFPKSFVLPCTIQDRIYLLEMIKNEIMTSKKTLYKLIKPSYLFFSNLLSLDTSKSGGALFTLHNKEKLVVIELLSIKINDMFIDYLDWLYESENVYSNEKTIEILDEKIDFLKSQL